MGLTSFLQFIRPFEFALDYSVFSIGLMFKRETFFKIHLMYFLNDLFLTVNGYLQLSIVGANHRGFC